MKRRSFKYYALIIVALLVINNLNFVANAFIKTTKIGFQIHISYDETGATIFTDASQVPGNIILKSLKDEQGNEYNPYEFKEHIKENGKYKYLLTYEDKNEQKEYSEEIVVVVKREITSENKNESNNQEDTVNKEDIKDTETISVDKLEKLSTGQENGYEIDAYASESSWSLGKTLTFKGGYFSDDSTFVNSINNRTFDKAYVIRNGLTEKIEIKGLFMSTDNNGKVNKYFVYEKGTDNDPVVGHKLNDNDKVYAYFKLKNETEHQIITINKPDGWDVSVSPAEISKIPVGANVVVTYTYPSHYKDDRITIKSNGGTVNFKEETKGQGTKTVSFTMPKNPVTIELTGNKESIERKVGLKVDNSIYYQPQDSGYFSLWMEPQNYDNTKIYRDFDSKTKFTDKYTFGIVNARGGDALNRTEINWIRGNYYGDFKKNFNGGGSTKIPSSEMIDGEVYTGSRETNNSKQGVHSVASFEQGETLEFNFVGSRAKWENDGKVLYRYVPNSSMQLRLFKDSNDFETEDYETINVPLFQNKDGYEEQIKNGELNESEVKVNDNLIIDNGFYPVSTKLANGMEIICYQKSYSDSNPGSLNTTQRAGKFDFIIKVKNAVDSFLINPEFTPESQQAYQLNMNMDAFEKDNNGSMIEAYDFKVNKKYIKVKDTDVVMIGNEKYDYYDFRMKIKPGYSYPYVYITDHYNNILTSNDRYTGPDSNKSVDISKPAVNELGRWWVNFKNGGSKLISDTIGVHRNDGYYHVRTRAVFDYGHAAYPMHIKSEPIQFTYDFSDGNGGSLLTGNNINVKNNKYFVVPSKIPESVTGEIYFKGWKLQVSLGNGNNIEIKDKNNKYFLPNDLIDITYISKKLADEFGIADVGKSDYNLKFTPEYTNVSSDSQFEIGRWERKYQDTYTEMSRDTGKEIQALKDEQLYLTYQSKIENPRENSMVFLGTYFLGVDSKVTGILKNQNDVIATLNYYKGLKVNYEANTIKGAQIDPVTDDNWYISKDIKISDAPPNTNKLSHEIQLKLPTTSNNNIEFEGWQLVNDKGRPFENGNIYKAGTILDLTKIYNKKIQNDIFTTGKINLKAVWKNKVKVVHEDNTTSPTKQAYQVAFEGEDLTLTAKFKYINTDGSQSSESFDSIKGSLKYALLKKDSSSNKYKVLLTESNNNSNNSGSIEVKDDGNQVFTIKASIKKDNIYAQTDTTSDYRIVAYTASNKGMEKIESSDLGGDNGILSLGDPNFTKHEVPIVSTNVYYGAVNNIIKYPKEIAMFEKVDGTIDSDIEEIKLMSYPNGNQTNNLPNSNAEFEVKVENDLISMKNVFNNGDSFKARVLNEQGVNITDSTLGKLKYDKSGTTVNSNVVRFKLKSENKRTSKDGEKFTGTLKFIFNKLPVAVNP